MNSTHLGPPPSALAVTYGLTKPGRLGDQGSDDLFATPLPNELIKLIERYTQECYSYSMVFDCLYHPNADLQDVDDEPDYNPATMNLRYMLVPQQTSPGAGRHPVMTWLGDLLRSEMLGWAEGWSLIRPNRVGAATDVTGLSYNVAARNIGNYVVNTPGANPFVSTEHELVLTAEPDGPPEEEGYRNRRRNTGARAQMQPVEDEFVNAGFQTIMGLRNYYRQSLYDGNDLLDWYPVQIGPIRGPFANLAGTDNQYQFDFEICKVVPFLALWLRKLEVEDLNKTPPPGARRILRARRNPKASSTYRRQHEEKTVLAMRLIQAHKTAGLEGMKALATSLGFDMNLS